MKSLFLTIIAIASVVFLNSCDSNSPTSNALSSEPVITQASEAPKPDKVWKTPQKFALTKIEIEEYNSDGEFNYNAGFTIAFEVDSILVERRIKKWTSDKKLKKNVLKDVQALRNFLSNKIPSEFELNFGSFGLTEIRLASKIIETEFDSAGMYIPSMVLWETSNDWSKRESTGNW